jgi:AcrR family transcriptional regulator
MGTQERREREKERRREEILNAAKELFITNGLTLTTIEDIAKKVELSQGAIYLYFKNKEELYASLNLMTLQFIYAETRKVFDNEQLGPEEKLLELKNVFYKTFEYDPLILRNIMRLQLEDALLTLSPELLTEINTLTKKTMNMMSEIYLEGVRQGKFRKENGVALADIMWTMFIGIVLYEEAKRRLNPKKDFLKPTFDKAFEIFLRGIKVGKTLEV